MNKKYSKDFKMQDEVLSKIENSIDRYHTYRVSDEVIDCDRNTIAMELYRELNWLSMNKLEPDTMYSYWPIEKLLLKKFDEDYYINNFREWCNEIGLNYEKSTHKELIPYRFKWLVLDSTKEHYSTILDNEVLLKFAEVTHTIGNFWLVPRGHNRIKMERFNDCPIKYARYMLRYETTNFLGEHNVLSYYDFLEKYVLNPRFDESVSLREDYSIEVILAGLDVINTFIEIRTEMICNILKEKK